MPRSTLFCQHSNNQSRVEENKTNLNILWTLCVRYWNVLFKLSMLSESCNEIFNIFILDSLSFTHSISKYKYIISIGHHFLVDTESRKCNQLIFILHFLLAWNINFKTTAHVSRIFESFLLLQNVSQKATIFC